MSGEYETLLGGILEQLEGSQSRPRPPILWNRKHYNIWSKDASNLAVKVLDAGIDVIGSGQPLGNACIRMGRQINDIYNLGVHEGVSKATEVRRYAQLGACALGTLESIKAAKVSTVRIDTKKNQNFLVANERTDTGLMLLKLTENYNNEKSPARHYEEWSGPVSSDGLTVITKLQPEDFHHYTYDKMPAEYDALNRMGSVKWNINLDILAFVNTIQGTDHPLATTMVTDEQLKDAYKQVSGFNLFLDSILDENVAKTQEWCFKNNVDQKIARRMVKNNFKKIRKEKLEPFVQVIRDHSKMTDELAVIQEANERSGETLQFRWFMCSRGRKYALVDNLDPQGCDLAKSLLNFQEGREWDSEGLYWLMVDLASSAGNDKLSFEDRIKWTMEHEEEILQCAQDPMNSELLKTLVHEKPWSFLKAALAFHDFHYNEDSLDHHNVPQDATCSGFQIMGALSGDERILQETNVIQHDNGLMGDAYMRVGEYLHELYQRNGHRFGKVELKPYRQLVKRSTMVFPYSAGEMTMQDNCWDDRSDNKCEEFRKMKWSDCRMVGTDTYKAIGEVFPGARDVMNKLIESIDDSDDPVISWKTPTGFRAYQRYSRQNNSITSVRFGTRKMFIRYNYDTGLRDRRKHANAISPNVIHSIDAALLTLVLQRLPRGPVSFIHDSLSCSSSNTEALRNAFMEAFCEATGPDTLRRIYEEISGNPLDSFEFGERTELTPEQLGEYIIN